MVTLLYFAWVREAVGPGEERLDLPSDIVTAGDLADWLATRDPGFATREKLRVAVDQEMADWKTDVRTAREIAFFPPVTGG